MTARRTTSVFAGFRFPPEVISVAVRWYLRYGLSYRDVEELLAERGITVDHVTIYRWVQRFTAEFIEAARPCRHVPGDRWFADETYVKVAGRWTYLYRAIDQHGQVIDVLLSQRRDLAAARRFFARALHAGTIPAEVITDRAPAYPRVLDELIPSALHTVERYANNPVEADHGRLKARLRPMRGLKRHRSARTWPPGMPSSRTSAAATTNSPPKGIRTGVTKTVAAFLNTDGGTLLIGVSDSGTVLGIEPDFKHFPARKRNPDAWLLSLKDVIVKALGRAVWSAVHVSLVRHGQGTVAVVHCPPRASETWHSDDAGERFYMRAANATHQLDGPSLLRYIREHWPG